MRESREDRGLGQEALARKAGVSQTTVSGSRFARRAKVRMKGLKILPIDRDEG
jgi:transcriptional regulator with XRE-family HTH domain